ncbi:MAG TPA: phospholipase D-like domain-containing protein [Pyrinomonadaceae bacterium]|nr:phospholipase D-like domain-containing protein [Pyrinomonadaceae bacterium]
MSAKVAPEKSAFEKWFDSLSTKDSALYNELKSRFDERVAQPEAAATPSGISFESIQRESDADLKSVVLETIVREGRPAIPILNNRVSFQGAVVDAAAETILNRLKQAVSTVEPCIPLVGRIDVDNYPGSLTYVGTSWLVGPNIAVTNRHVAELIARSDNGKFRFRPGRFGEDLRVSLDYRHELGMNATNSVRVGRVIWIERDSRGPDIAFLELDQRSDGTKKPFIPLAEKDAKANDEVVVIGYPARAPAHIIPNQEWMDQIYGGKYDVKRIAPGLVGTNSRGWATHDCTTLGGNSGSVVVDMTNGQAVALHFAGLYMIENYAVPASTIRRYLRERPWHGESVTKPAELDSEKQGQIGGVPQAGSSSKPVSRAGNGPATSTVETRIDRGQVSMTIPLTVTVSLGAPVGTSGEMPVRTLSRAPAETAPHDIDEAARELQRERRVEGVYLVWPGYKIEQGRLTDVECLVVSAHPDRVENVRAAMPAVFGKYPVEVRPASIEMIAEATGQIEEAVAAISYNDNDRTSEGFSFNWVDEEMTVVLHVGPERSWVVLSEFLKRAERELVSSMYEFKAAHIAQAIEQPLNDGSSLQLVLAIQSRDPENNEIENGDFDRSETFERWEDTFENKFERIFVPLGANGLVSKSYHIKVTVADGSKIWLSSGNWKRSSQPVIPSASLDNPIVTSKAGNREWHVVMENDTLARRFRNHIKADFERSLELGGTEEALQEEVLVDVPLTVLESAELEAPAARVLTPLTISRRLKVKPLLTPDKKGAVFSKAVLRLIRSAESQLLFQNQYIKMGSANSGFLKQLVDALIEKSKELEDFRIILRKENDSLQFDLSELKRRGVNVEEQVKVLSNTHTKGLIVDGKRVLVGSHNWSGLGVTLNRDASLIFDDEEVAQYYTEAFEIDWERASEPRLDEVATEGVRLAEGAEPPPGYVRMTLSEYLEG